MALTQRDKILVQAAIMHGTKPAEGEDHAAKIVEFLLLELSQPQRRQLQIWLDELQAIEQGSHDNADGIAATSKATSNQSIADIDSAKARPELEETP